MPDARNPFDGPLVLSDDPADSMIPRQPVDLFGGSSWPEGVPSVVWDESMQWWTMDLGKDPTVARVRDCSLAMAKWLMCPLGEIYVCGLSTEEIMLVRRRNGEPVE